MIGLVDYLLQPRRRPLRSRVDSYREGVNQILFNPSQGLSFALRVLSRVEAVQQRPILPRGCFSRASIPRVINLVVSLLRFLRGEGRVVHVGI